MLARFRTPFGAGFFHEPLSPASVCVIGLIGVGLKNKIVAKIAAAAHIFLIGLPPPDRVLRVVLLVLPDRRRPLKSASSSRARSEERHAHGPL